MGQAIPSGYRQGNSNWWQGGEIIKADDLNKIEQALDKIIQGMPDFVIVDEEENIGAAAEKPYNKLYITNQRELSVVEGSEFNSFMNLIAPPYTAGNSYNQGDLVIYSTQSNQGVVYKLYRCKTQVDDAPATLNTSYWTNLSSIKSNSFNYVKQIASTQDLNDIRQIGWYKIKNGTTNMPINMNMGMLVFNDGTEFVIQIAFPLSNNGSIYYRQYLKGLNDWRQWKVLTIGAQLENIKQMIYDEISAVNGEEVYHFTSGSYINTNEGGSNVNNPVNIDNPSSSSAYKCVVVECQPNDKFTLTGACGPNTYHYLWCFLNSDKYKISGAISPSPASVVNATLTAPENARYLVCNAYADQPAFLCKNKSNTIKINELNTRVEAVQNDVSQIGANISQFPIIENDINNIKESLYPYEQRILPDESIEDNYWKISETQASLVSHTSYNAFIKQVRPYEKYRINNLFPKSTKSGPYAVVDQNYNILIKKFGDDTRINDTIEIPYNGKYLLMSRHSSYSLFVYKSKLNVYGQGVFPYKGKNVAIIGDSVSTNGNWTATNTWGNVPEVVIQPQDVGQTISSYVTFYDASNNTTIGGHQITQQDVAAGEQIEFIPTSEDIGKVIGVPKTNYNASTIIWWQHAAWALGFNPIPVCWSGSSITSHEDNVTEQDSEQPDEQHGGYILKNSYAWHDSQIRKCGIRVPGTNDRIAPDMIIIARGGNDLTHAPYAKLTNYMDDFPTTYPEEDTYEDNGTIKYDFAKGLRLTIKKLREAYPEAKIVLCTLHYIRRLSTSTYFTKNSNNDSWNTYNNMIRRIAQHEGCDLIEFDKCGLMWSNAANDYYNENAKWTHPTNKGHKVMGNRAIIDLLKINGMD